MTAIRTLKHRPNRRSLRIKLDSPMPGEFSNNINVIALDPGATTGFASFQYSNFHMRLELEISQFMRDDLLKMKTQMARVGSKAYPPTIVFEQYVARKVRGDHLGAEAKRALSPVDIMGRVQGWYDERLNPETPIEGVKVVQMPTFVPQQASMMASMADKRLKTMFPDIYKLTLGPALPHGRDALRHLLVYLKRYHFDHYQALKPPGTTE